MLLTDEEPEMRLSDLSVNNMNKPLGCTSGSLLVFHLFQPLSSVLITHTLTDHHPTSALLEAQVFMKLHQRMKPAGCAQNIKPIKPRKKLVKKCAVRKNSLVYTVTPITCFPIGVKDKYSTEGWLFITSIDSNIHATTFAVAEVRLENIQALQHQSGGRSRECAHI